MEGEVKPPKLLRTVFLRAIEVLKERGWRQGGSNPALVQDDGKCSVCMEEAVSLAVDGQIRNSHWESFRFLRGVIREHQLFRWNDAKGRTKRQVIAALRRAAKLAGSKRVAP